MMNVSDIRKIKSKELSGFTQWLENLIHSKKFIKISEQYINIQKMLKSEIPDPVETSFYNRPDHY